MLDISKLFWLTVVCVGIFFAGYKQAINDIPNKLLRKDIVCKVLR